MLIKKIYRIQIYSFLYNSLKLYHILYIMKLIYKNNYILRILT